MRVVYILATGHSGSTVLGTLIGNTKPAIHIGEFANFVKVVNGELETCSCYRLPRDCVFWSVVLSKFESELLDKNINLTEFERIRADVEQNIITNKFNNSDFEVLKVLTIKLFNIIEEVSGKSIIVDSSKSPNRAMVLSKIFGDKFSVIYLMRDYVGVINSFKRKNKSLKIFNFLRSLFREHMKIIYVIRKNKLSNIRILYENLFSQDKIDILLMKLKIPGDIDLSGQFLNQHVIAGNRMRYKERFLLENKHHENFNLNITEKTSAKFFDFLRKVTG